MSFAPPPTADSEPDPPYYILLQQASGGAQTAPSSASNFVHPIIEYHFADDPPSTLLPASDAEAIVIIDYDGSSFPPTVRSLHPDLAVAGMKLADAPGAAAALPRRNDKMYVVETMASGDSGPPSDSGCELDNPQVMLAQFKERNAALKKVLNSIEPTPNTA